LKCVAGGEKVQAWNEAFVACLMEVPAFCLERLTVLKKKKNMYDIQGVSGGIANIL
jgi:hypothetical protein